MATLDRTRLTTNDLFHRMADLAKAAGESGDGFLQYIYIMALHHIEEASAKGRKRQERRAVPASADVD